MFVANITVASPAAASDLASALKAREISGVRADDNVVRIFNCPAATADLLQALISQGLLLGCID